MVDALQQNVRGDPERHNDGDNAGRGRTPKPLNQPFNRSLIERGLAIVVCVQLGDAANRILNMCR